MFRLPLGDRTIMADVPRTGGSPLTPVTPSDGPRRRWHPRALLRGAPGAALIAAVTGALLGAGLTAWGSGSGPFARSAADWCGGTFADGDVERLFRGAGDVRQAELPLWEGRRSLVGPAGTCRLTTENWQVTVRVHRLDTEWTGEGRWANEFLAARLSPLGGGLLGMASDTRAWLAVPDGCEGRPGEGEGPTVVDISSGSAGPRDDVDVTDRAALARSVVRAVNGLLAGEDCAGRLADPVKGLPEPPEHQAEAPDALCGVKGLRLPGKREFDEKRPLITRGAGPVRTCDRGESPRRPGLRLMTVADPRLARVFDRLVRSSGAPVRHERGRGVLRADLGAFQADCPTGPVVFLVAADDGDRAADIRAVFSGYVRAEAQRVGCGTVRVTLPGPAASG
ncbi:hypothetical protein [Streptomyces uncialis]|uniref:hypothetical protein n=1 Tax=Streptomyces uncialis TaxID=1048205 RepID=UPI00386B2586|nr:hypothetical protein OG924_33865 [Streptomyces uncialis]